jgi:hypothetical protein
MSQPQVQDTGRQFRQWVYLLIIAVAVAAQLERMANLTSWRHPGQADWPWPGKVGRYKPPHTPLLSANDRSRWCTVWALVERGTYQIDAFERVQGWNSIDKVKKDGHYYSSKPPLLSTCVAGVYWCLKHGFGMNLLRIDKIEAEMVVNPTRNPPDIRRFAFTVHQAMHGTVQLILILINLIPFAISLWLFAGLAERYAKSDLTRVLIVTVAAWGTFLSTFLITLNNHTVAANCVLWSLCAGLKILADGDHRRRWFLLAGFFAAYSVTCELPSGIFLLWLGLLLLRANWRRTLIWFAGAMLVPLAAHFYLNYIIVGGFLPFYASFGKDYYNYKGSYWLDPKGMDANVQPPWLYLLHCTFGHHGIFSLTPVFLISIRTWMGRISQLIRGGFKAACGLDWELEDSAGRSADHRLAQFRMHHCDSGVLLDSDRQLQLRRSDQWPAMGFLVDSTVIDVDDSDVGCIPRKKMVPGVVRAVIDGIGILGDLPVVESLELSLVDAADATTRVDALSDFVASSDFIES